jgi:hypothetical protein
MPRTRAVDTLVYDFFGEVLEETVREYNAVCVPSLLLRNLANWTANNVDVGCHHAVEICPERPSTPHF